MLSNSLVSPHETILDPLGEAYQRWRSVRTRLAHTIQDYVGACNTLNAALSHHSQHNSLEQTLVNVDAELSSLEKDYEHILRAHAILSRNRNQSKKLVSINNLPPEILSQIFRFAAFNCVYQRRTRIISHPYVIPDVLAGVCSAWRKIVAHLPSFWSHIDLSLNKHNTEGYYRCARSWSKRSGNAPIHVHIYPIINPTAFEESDVLGLLHYLASLAKNIESLDMEFAPSAEEIGRRILACWATHGRPAIARSLVLGGMGGSLVQLQPRAPNETASISRKKIDNFLSSIQTLQLFGVHVPWKSSVYRGLSSLFIEYGRGPSTCWATQSQLATVLESSPRLRELKLIDLNVQPGGWLASKQITLKDLEVLAVHGCASIILPMITPGSNPLRMSFYIDPEPVPLEAIHSFFACSVVDTLHMMNPWDNKTWFSYLLGPLQHLKTLVISGCPFNVPDIQDFLMLPSEQRATPWPKLHTLHLSECMLQYDILLKFLSKHSVQTLNFHSCTTTRSSDEPGEAEEEMLKLKELLVGSVLDIVLNNHHEDDPSYSYIR